ncbi:hippocampus abundant transcript 1 protein-like [Sarcoptes scabiei]|nr:hippocampus abundant transcript 1 protein-like [Sarcoptes scabiei]
MAFLMPKYRISIAILICLKIFPLSTLSNELESSALIDPIIDEESDELTPLSSEHHQQKFQQSIQSNMDSIQMSECHLRPVIHILQRSGCIPKPIPSFACYGTCNSYVQVSNSKFWQIERSCNCCQEIGERETSITLHCPNRIPSYRKVITKAPVECLCRPCSAVDERQIKPLEISQNDRRG